MVSYSACRLRLGLVERPQARLERKKIMENVLGFAVFSAAAAGSCGVAFLAAKVCLGGLLRLLR
jgi:hypothetical protein